MQNPVAEPFIERAERFQSLQSGQYWRAMRDVPEEGIRAGLMLLITTVRWVDDSIHTIALRPHPDLIGKQVTLELPDADGSIAKRKFLYDEHRFLLRDFLDAFEFAPDHEEVRRREQAMAAGRINELQAQLLQAQSDPTILAAVVQQALPAPQPGEGPQLPVAPDAAEAASVAGGSLAQALGGEISAQRLDRWKEAAQREHQIATIKAQWIQSKTNEIAQAITALTPYYEEQAAAALACTAQVREHVARLLEGIGSLDLYVGKDVEVITLREGPSAPPAEPLTFMQRKLVMDEELALWADVDEDFDVEHLSSFDAAVREHIGLIEQIFPTPRCVVAMYTTRRYIDYGDGLVSAVRNRTNKEVFLLVRDGLNVYRVHSPVETHLGASRLFPTRSEANAIFQGVNGEQIRFEHLRYTDRLEEHERHALHYKRFLILACGLDHRLKLFGDFYPGPASFKFVSLEFQQRYCRFLQDEELALADASRPDLLSWIESKNAYLTSGSRVLCHWRELMNPDSAPAACKVSGRDSYSYHHTYLPEHSISLAVAQQRGDEIGVSAPVSGTGYAYRERSFQCKVSITRYERSSWSEKESLGWLCLDAVSPEELDYYMRSRQGRARHLFYIRFFKHALKLLGEERASQAPTREAMLKHAGQCRTAHALVEQAVLAWRAANRGASLPSAQDWERVGGLSEALSALMAGGKPQDEWAERFAQANNLTPLRLVVTGQGKFVLYAALAPEARDDRFEPHAWVERIRLRANRGGFVAEGRTSVLLPAVVAAESTLVEWGQCQQWLGRSSLFGSCEDKGRAFERVEQWRQMLGQWVGPSDQSRTALYEAFVRERRTLLATSKLVKWPTAIVPVGLVADRRHKRARLSYLVLACEDPHVQLHRLATDEHEAQRIWKETIALYRSRLSGAERFDASKQQPCLWHLMLVNPDQVIEGVPAGLFAQAGTGIYGDRPLHDPRLGSWLASWMGQQRDMDVWLARDLFDPDGALGPDRLVGAVLPPDYAPHEVIEVSGRFGEESVRWVDVRPVPQDRMGELAVRGFGHSDAYKELLQALSSSSMRPSSALTYAGALDKVERVRVEVAEEGRRLVPSDEIPRWPQPPEGVQRWFVCEG